MDGQMGSHGKKKRKKDDKNTFVLLCNKDQ
jgi:hypothetical protein